MKSVYEVHRHYPRLPPLQNYGTPCSPARVAAACLSNVGRACHRHLQEAVAKARWNYVFHLLHNTS
jgi:hypothetical protein